MKLSISLALFALTAPLACSQERPAASPAAAPTGATLPTQTALVSAADPGATAQPGAATIPTNTPAVAAPVAPAPSPAAEKPLMPSSGAGTPRPTTADLVPGNAPPLDPARDKAHSDADRESVSEIRALLAADKSLSATARRVTIVAQAGRVRLSGQVNTADERAAIERAARQAANVREVKNELVVLE